MTLLIPWLPPERKRNTYGVYSGQGLYQGKHHRKAGRCMQGRGRSAFVVKDFRGGNFVCDYGGVVRKNSTRLGR